MAKGYKTCSYCGKVCKSLGFARHRAMHSDNNKEIRRLQAKKDSVGLTKEEEKKYCKLNSKETGYPEIFFTKEFSNKLDNAIKKTDQLIKKINETKRF